MKYLFTSITLFVLLFGNLNAQNYGLDNTDPAVFCKFKIPETKLSSLWFNTNFSFNSNKSNVSSSLYQQGSSSYNSRISYSLSPSYYFLNENDDRTLSLDINTEGLYSRYYNEVNDEYYNKENNYELHLNFDGRFRQYFTSNNIFYSLTSESNVDIQESTEDYPKNNVNNDYNGSKYQNYTFSIGMGWGKLRHVTSVVSAIRFQERLKQLNLLDNNLREEVIVKLAEQFHRAGYYSNVYSRPEKYIWSSIENTLVNEGVFINNLNQYSNSYLREIPTEIRFSRREGFVIGTNLQLDYDNNYYSDGNPRINEHLNILVNLYSEYSHQINLNSQISGSLSLRCGPSVDDKNSYKQLYHMNASLGYDFELTDRIVTSIYNSFDLVFLNYSYQQRNVNNYLRLQVDYFIEDNISLNSTYYWRYYQRKNPTYSTTSNNYNNIQLGFTYYIDRGFLYR